MTPMAFADPWWITCIKAVGVLVFLLLFTLFNIVFERKVVAKMQNRVGPTMNGPSGSLQSLADGVAALRKPTIAVVKGYALGGVRPAIVRVVSRV